MPKLGRTAIALTAASVLAAGGGSVAVARSVDPSHADSVVIPAGMTHVKVHPMPMMPMSFDYAKQLSTLRGKKLEVTFLAGMIPHHRAAIDMAMMAQRRAVHPELRTMAANIVASQHHEVQQMTTWLSAWYGLTPSEAITASSAAARIRMMDKQMAADMTMLRDLPAGPMFDKMFVQMMIPHHQMAINEAQPAQDYAVHSQLLRTANDIVSSQEQEVQQLLGWLLSWYG